MILAETVEQQLAQLLDEQDAAWLAEKPDVQAEVAPETWDTFAHQRYAVESKEWQKRRDISYVMAFGVPAPRFFYGDEAISEENYAETERLTKVYKATMGNPEELFKEMLA